MLAISIPEVDNYFNLRFKMVYFEMTVGSRTSQIPLRRPTSKISVGYSDWIHFTNSSTGHGNDIINN
jgi:hypothetical protein